MKLNNWCLVINKSGCSVGGATLVVVMVDGIMWLSRRSVLWIQIHNNPHRELSLKRMGKMGGFQCKSLFESTSEREVCVRACKNGCMSSSFLLLPHPSLCLLCWRGEEVRHCYYDNVTVYCSCGGSERPSGEMLALCKLSKLVWLSKVCSDAVQNVLGTTASEVTHSRNHPGLSPVCCHPGPRR